jgi:hypothetical protein
VKKSDSLVLQINHFRLEGLRYQGRWKLTCKEWPGLAKRFDGDDYCTGILWEFTTLALSGGKVGNMFKERDFR